MNPVDITFIETFISAVGNVGFPLVLAVYLLLRFEKKIEVLTDAISNLKEAINKREDK